MAAFTTFMQVGVFAVVPGVTVWAAWHRPWVAVPLICLYAITLFDGAEKDSKRKRAWPLFGRRFWLFKFMRGYFPQVLHVPKDFPASKAPAEKGESQQYFFAVHPHGCMSEFRMLMDGQFLDQLPGLEGKQVCWLAASILFRLPICRELCLWSGCCDAGRATAEKMLKAGLSVGVIPGGEHEQMLTTYGKEIIYIKKRLGFVKLALRFGVPLVPCYVFGVSDSYHTSEFLIDLRMALVKSLGIAIPFCWGAFGLPLAPFQTPVNIVMGQPIPVEKVAEPTNEQVVAAHAQYVEALQKVFDENKARFGYGERSLQLE